MTPQGRYWRTDSQGNLLNDAHTDWIPAAYQPLIQAGIAAFTHHIEADLHSLYLVGSLPRGQAVLGQTTLQLCGVLEYSVDPELVKQDWLPLTEAHLLKNHAALVCDVQLELWPQGFIFRDPTEFSIGAFLLATQSVCLWGSDVAAELPMYNLRHAVTRLAIANDDIFNFPYDLDEAWERLEADDSVENVRDWCQQICQYMLYTGFSLVLDKVQAYSRDAALCCAAFCQHYPAQATAQQQALHWTRQPTSDGAALQEFLAGHGEWLIDQCEAWLEEHNPAHLECFPLDTEEDR